MTNETRERLDVFADDLFKKLNMTIPVDIDAAVDKLGGTIIDAPAKLVEDKGDIFVADDHSFTIYVDETCTDEIRSARVAQLISFYFILIKHNSVGECVKLDRVKTIMKCNEFARDFLVPLSQFKASISHHSHDDSVDIVKIANEFGVSVPFLMQRGINAGIINGSTYELSGEEEEKRA